MKFQITSAPTVHGAHITGQFENGTKIDIHCYGKVDADGTNYHIVYDHADGSEGEDFACDIEVTTWRAVGVQLLEAAHFQGCEIYEISAC